MKLVYDNHHHSNIRTMVRGGGNKNAKTSETTGLYSECPGTGVAAWLQGHMWGEKTQADHFHKP